MKRVLSVLFSIVLLAGCASTTPVGTQPDSSVSSGTASGASSQAVSSAISSEAASSQVVKKELPAAPEMEKGWWKKALSKEELNNHEFGMRTCMVYQNVEGICTYPLDVFVDNETGPDFSLLMNTAKESTDIGKPLDEPAFFELELWDNTVYRGAFYERGIALTPIMPGKRAGEAVLLEVSHEDYQKVLTDVKTLFNQQSNREIIQSYYPAELLQLRCSICNSIEMASSDGKKKGVFTREPEWKLNYIVRAFQELAVDPASKKSVDKTVALPSAVTAQMQFLDGSSCDIQCDGKMLQFVLSDAEKAIVYNLYNPSGFDRLESLNQIAAGNIIPETGKPVIYLYPEQPTDVAVKLDYKGQFTYTYPAYNNGWQVTAYPDGRLVNKADSSEHYYLFWEGNAGANWRFDEGFVIKGEDTEKFLVSALKTMGLTPREYNDFIVYWLPEMQQNPYNLITFATDEYEQLAPLTITPKPDSILRVHMVYRALNEPVEIKEQKLPPFERKGFTVVEWGGTRG